MIFVIILAHEFGHYITAVWTGVRVKEFSLGFGTRLWGRKSGGTEYNLRAIPIGGFVELAGTDPKLAEEESDIPEQEKFINKNVLQRFLILFAGSFFNFLLALLIFAIIFIFIGIPQPKYTKEPTIGSLLPGKPAEAAKFKTGDLITGIDGITVETWDSMADIITRKPGMPLTISYLRQGILERTVVTPELNKTGEGIIGIVRGVIPVVGEMVPGKPAALAGILEGDRILSINGETICNWERAVEIINHNVDKELSINIERKSGTLTVKCKPEFSQELEAGIIGIGFVQEFVKGTNPLSALRYAWENTVQNTFFMMKGIAKLVSGKIALKNVTGPIGIAGVVKHRADRGIGALLSVIALLSLNIGLINLFPFPALDGGRILFLLIEVLMRRKVSIKVEEMIHLVGLYALLLLLVLVSYRDFKNLEFIRKLNLF